VGINDDMMIHFSSPATVPYLFPHSTRVFVRFYYVRTARIKQFCASHPRQSAVCFPPSFFSPTFSAKNVAKK
jgi:hypothetical protein